MRTGKNGTVARAIIVLALLLASGAMARAELRIVSSPGGEVESYLRLFAMVRQSGERVIIDGNCLSACTLVLGLVPHERICVTHRARFGFHAAWMPDRDGRAVTSPLGTQALWSIYPASVRRWILTHGGLSREMIFLQGRDLNGIVASCDRDPREQARSARRLTPNPVRYESASASSDRR